MKKIISNYIYNFSYQLFIIITPLITAPFLARALGPDAIGVISYVNSVASLICTFGLLGIYNYGCRQIAYVRDDALKLSQTFYELVFIRLCLIFLISVVYFFVVHGNKYLQIFNIYYIWVLANVMDISWFFIGIEDMGPASIKNMLAKLITIIGIFMFIDSPSDIWKYALLLTVPTFLSNVSLYFRVRKYLMYPYLNLKILFTHLQGSIKLFLPQMATLIFLQIDKIMIELFTQSTIQVAYYEYSEKIVKMPLSFITTIGIVMMPRIANIYMKGQKDKVENNISNIIKISALFSIPMTIGVAILSKTLIPWYLGMEYLSVVSGVILMSPVITLIAFSNISGNQYFIATGNTAILTKSYSFALLLNICINLLLIPRFGFLGAAFATVVAEFCCLIIQYKLLIKEISLSKVRINIINYIISALIMGVVASLISLFYESSIQLTCLLIVICTLSYFSILYILRDDFFTELVNKLLIYLNKYRRKNG